MTVHLRRLLATTTIGLALFGAAACADQPQDEPKASASPTKAPTTLADKKTTCDAYLALYAETTAKASPLAAAAQNAQQDPSAALNALVQFKSLIADYEAKLSPIDANAGDTQVKAALDAELANVRQTKADVDAAGLDQDKLQAAFENQASNHTADAVKAACGAS